ncbi:CLAVATA3/ESR (CLE)-related protein 25 [Glycine soja]|nr:CLAVATA3/ESR (CLE)-related protein 25 [Glycine max]
MGVGGVISCKKLLLGALVSLGVIWFMFLAISVNRQTKRTVLVPMNVISKHLKLVSMQRHALHSNSGLFIVSKRRVPNGPDPIHNRFEKDVTWSKETEIQNYESVSFFLHCMGDRFSPLPVLVSLF